MRTWRGCCATARPTDHVAFTMVDAAGGSSTLTFGQLAADSHRYARALQNLGVGPGDRVATLAGKSAELVTTILAIWRLGAVYVPLFTAFAPQAIALRLGARAPGWSSWIRISATNSSPARTCRRTPGVASW
jgi:acetyl-CoA synthetase